jgi:hypothetical protein
MKGVRLWSLVLLVFLGVGGIMGGAAMALDPYGIRWPILPLSLLRYSPFDSYRIPGTILLVSNGLLPLWVALRVKRRQPQYGLWTALQGCVLLGWLAVECLMLRLVAWPHLLYAAIGLLLIAFGFWMHRALVQTAVQG